jgi:hypothetical protein
MTFIPTQTGFMRLEDSQRLLRAIFPNYPSLEPCHSAPLLEPIPRGSKEDWNEERMSLC